MMLTVNKKKLCNNELIHAGFRLCEEINRYGYEAYLVGGCVRDILMNKQIHDVDVATNMPIDELKDKFYWHDNNGEKHGTILVNFAGHYIETTQFRADGNYSDGRHPDSVEFSKSFEEDTKRRDFTINAIVLDADGKIVDFQNGQKDIEAGIIRAVGDPVARFNEDALRILRALRFASRFMFTIEWNTARAIQETKHKLTLIARERIGDEIRKASEYGDTQFNYFVNLLIQYGLTDIIEPCKCVDWQKAKLLIGRYIEEKSEHYLHAIRRQEYADLMLAFVIAHSPNVPAVIQEFRYDNKLFGLMKFIKEYQDLGWSSSFTVSNVYRLTKASKSEHFRTYLRYMHSHYTMTLTSEQIRRLHKANKELVKYHDYITQKIVDRGYTGKDYGDALRKYEEYICWKVYTGVGITQKQLDDYSEAV